MVNDKRTPLIEAACAGCTILPETKLVPAVIPIIRPVPFKIPIAVQVPIIDPCNAPLPFKLPEAVATPVELPTSLPVALKEATTVATPAQDPVSFPLALMVAALVATPWLVPVSLPFPLKAPEVVAAQAILPESFPLALSVPEAVLVPWADPAMAPGPATEDKVPVTVADPCADPTRAPLPFKIAVMVAVPAAEPVSLPLAVRVPVTVATPEVLPAMGLVEGVVSRTRINTPGPLTFVVVPPAVAVMVGFAEPVPAVTEALQANPPISLPVIESYSPISVTALKVIPVWVNAWAENWVGVVTSVGIHIAPITISPEVTPGLLVKAMDTLPAEVSSPTAMARL